MEILQTGWRHVIKMKTLNEINITIQKGRNAEEKKLEKEWSILSRFMFQFVLRILSRALFIVGT